jgi:hypothetical protein
MSKADSTRDAKTASDNTVSILGFEQGKYPYAKKLNRKAYEAEKSVLRLSF